MRPWVNSATMLALADGRCRTTGLDLVGPSGVCPPGPVASQTVPALAGVDSRVLLPLQAPVSALEPALWIWSTSGIAALADDPCHAAVGDVHLDNPLPKPSKIRAVGPSVGSVDASYDNVLTETINGLLEDEAIHRRGSVSTAVVGSTGLCEPAPPRLPTQS